jgi:hypothetical protein
MNDVKLSSPKMQGDKCNFNLYTVYAVEFVRNRQVSLLSDLDLKP